MSKTYAKLNLTEQEFQRVHGALITNRNIVEEKAQHTAGDEQRFYLDRKADYEALIRRCDAILTADTSQDAEPDDDDEDVEAET